VPVALCLSSAVPLHAGKAVSKSEFVRVASRKEAESRLLAVLASASRAKEDECTFFACAANAVPLVEQVESRLEAT